MKLSNKIQQDLQSISDNKKTEILSVKFNCQAAKDLKSIAAFYNTNKSAVIRLAVDNLFNAINQEKNNNNNND